jgi:hypothetical protein
MKIEPELLGFIYVISVLTSILLMRAIFSIPSIVRQLKSQTNLLMLIAKKQGATENEVHNAIVYNDSIFK